ncbi:DUF2461 family protein, partial [Kribbella solani]|uniref:DUF2461 family protein n=1 Tax=Kribbella solani TaxID=236067 RepID=UPI0029A95622
NPQKCLTQPPTAGRAQRGAQLEHPPRGERPDHPRIDLLRHKTLTVGKNYGFEPVIHTASLTTQIRTDWRATNPLIAWLTDNT